MDARMIRRIFFHCYFALEVFLIRLRAHASKKTSSNHSDYLKKFKNRKNQKGMATFEALPLLVIFVMLTSYTLGLYGIVHSATLNSIAARTYAFETFRNRANLTYFRDFSRSAADAHYYSPVGFRLHAVTNSPPGQHWVAPRRPITMGRPPLERSLASQNQTNLEVHNNGVFDLEERNREVSVSPAWIMVRYGICLDSTCGASTPSN